MKKLVVTTILILGLTVIPIYAQQEELPTEPGGEEMQIEIQEDEVEIQIQEEQEEEESTPLSEELEVTEQNSLGFWSILFATITPALLIIIAYLLIKMANK